MRPATAVSEELHSALERFHSLDWTFEKAKTNVGLHSIHPYPAKFIPQIPRNLVKLFHSAADGPVLDPFCGSGTTLVECQAMGIASYGIDVNPIAVLVSKVKTNPPDQEISIIASRLVSSAEASTNDALPDIPRLTHWFSPGAIVALTKLTRALMDIPNPIARDALKLALSRIIVRVSRQDSDTRYAAVDRSFEESEVYQLYIESAQVLDNVFRMEHSNMFRRSAPSGVLAKDLLAG